MTTTAELTVAMPDGLPLPALWLRPAEARAALVLAHGAGAGMRHRGMAAVAEGLASRGIATLRFEFPYMAKGSRRPDTPSVAQAAVRAAVQAGRALADGLPVFAGGRSFGGRMTSGAQSTEPLAGVRGLVFFAFPLHPSGKPGTERAAHLATIEVPMLFLQGTRDTLAALDLLQPVVAGLGERATLVLAEGADHSFHVPRASGRTDAEVMDDMLDAAARWIGVLTP